MKKLELTMRVIREAREYSSSAIMFHQAIGGILGISATEMKCLDIMMLNGSSNPTAVSEYTGLSTGATTALLDRLETAKLIERHPDPNDRRATIVALSREANRKLQSLFDSMASAMEELASRYSAKELIALSDFFQKATILWKNERKKLSL